jgi:ribosomal-protein-alanine N-acetyltransferase
MLAALFDQAISRNASLLSLEVRVTNQIAQRLYMKYGMSVQGVRARYYTDNGEDAYIMWSRSLRDPLYVQQLDQLRAEIVERVGEHLLDSPIFSIDPAYEYPEAAP